MICENFLLILVLIGNLVFTNGFNNSRCPNLKTNLTNLRKRRHIAFPEKSVFSITGDIAKTFMSHAPSGWYLTMDIDLLFDLPDDKFIAAHSRKKLYHRQKKEYWKNLKDALSYHNIDGHACLLRSICDSRQHLAPPGKSLVHDLLRAIFEVPHRNDIDEESNGMYEELSDPHLCDHQHSCPFSVIEFISG